MKNSLVVVVLGSSAALGQAQVFTTRSSFDAAISAPIVDGFEGYPNSGGPSSGAMVSLSFLDFTVSTSPAAAKVFNDTISGAHNTTPGGSKYLYLDTDLGRVGSASTFVFTDRTTAFGFDYTAIGEADNTFTAMIGGRTFTISTSVSSVDGFWGYVGAPFDTVVLTTTTDSGYGVDQVAYTPGPGAALTLIAGAGLACQRRRGSKRGQ